MTNKITHASHLRELKEYEKRFLTQEQFPPFSREFKDKIEPILHTGHLLFIRSKFLFLGLKQELKQKNLFAAWSILKTYWENVAAFGFYFLKISYLLKENKKEEAFILSRKLAMGGRGFPSKEMVLNRGDKVEDFWLPNILTMMDLVDNDWQKITGKKIDSLLRELYETVIAEGGHTTYTGLSISGKWMKNKSFFLPDINKSWSIRGNREVSNLYAMASTTFFYYWNKFERLSNETKNQKN